MHNQKTQQPALNILTKVFPWILATCMAAMMLAFPLRALATSDRARAFADGVMNAAVMVGGTTCLVVNGCLCVRCPVPRCDRQVAAA